ncbi:PH domain-containing protein [Tessaracoccus sp. G1721]
MTDPTPVATAVAEKVVERPSPLTGLAHSGIVLAASVVFLVRELDQGIEALTAQALIFGLVALGAALVAGVYGIFAWRTTAFIVDDEEFRVERAFISRSSSRVDYTKVQSVDIAQPFVARLLGLAKVHIDVGGAGGLTLAFLTRARAESLREHLLSRMALARSGPVVALSPGEPGTQYNANPVPTVDEPEELVHAVSPATLILGTAVSTPAVAALLVAGVVIGTSVWAEAPVTFFGAVLAFAGWAWSNVGRNWGFRMTRRGDTLRISRGLASTTAQGLRPDRIQGVVVHQDLLQRLTGLYRVTVTVLGYGDPSGEESSSSNSVVLPFGRWADVLTVLHAIWPGVDLNLIHPTPQPARARWLTPFSHARHTWGVGEDVLVAHHGLIEHAMTIVPHRRMQSLSLHQGPLQRRLGLATVAVHTTDGPVSLRAYHLDESVARKLFDDQLERGRDARASAVPV